MDVRRGMQWNAFSRVHSKTHTNLRLSLLWHAEPLFAATMRERPSPYATYIHIDVYFTMYRRDIVPWPLGLHCFAFCMSSPAYIISAVAVTSVEEHSWFAVSILRGVNRGAHFFLQRATTCVTCPVRWAVWGGELAFTTKRAYWNVFD